MRKLTEQEQTVFNQDKLNFIQYESHTGYEQEGIEGFEAGFAAALKMQDKRIAKLEAQLAELLNGLKVGDKVQLKHNPALGTATIVSTISDVRGGVVLDKDLDHFKCWNVEDLEKVEK